MASDLEWDPEKEQKNFQKHKVSFSEAVTALEDETAMTIEDDHPDERRFVTLGLSESGRLLVVVYTFRGESIRIISARKASISERNTYTGSDT